MVVEKIGHRKIKKTSAIQYKKLVAAQNKTKTGDDKSALGACPSRRARRNCSAGTAM
jgi:hypothetical protein